MELARTLTAELVNEIRNASMTHQEFITTGTSNVTLRIQRATFNCWVAGSHEEFSLLISTNDKLGARHLRTLLSSGQYSTRVDANTYSLISGTRWSKEKSRESIRRIEWFIESSVARYSLLNPHGALDGLLPMYWWDNKSNFGDDIGAWLSARISGYQPANMRQSGRQTRTLMSVGSIIAQIENSQTEIWGSGLIAPLSKAQSQELQALGQIEVHAVRGKLTAQHLREQLGWNVPDIYGDPALLLPRYLSPATRDGRSSVAFVPHYAHENVEIVDQKGINRINVALDVETVVHAITSSKVVVSTSLHGIIVAQAYGIPWVWLQLLDSPLKGDDFKFRDFFSTLTGVEPSVYKTHTSNPINISEIAKLARLPRLAVNLDELEKAFPMEKQKNRRKLNAKNILKKLLPTMNIRKILKVGLINRLDSIIANQNQLISTLNKLNDSDLTVSNKIVRELEQVRKDQRDIRGNLESLRRHAQAQNFKEIRSVLEDNHMSLLQTLEMLATTDASFARFGDGEFRLMLHPDEDIQFQQNHPQLRKELTATLQASSNENLLVGFPQLYTDTNWASIWADLWVDLREIMPRNSRWANAHVTRPLVFKKHRDDAVTAWRKVWDGKTVCVITGSDSRFELVPELFDNVSAVSRIYSTPRDAFSDLDRTLQEVEQNDADIFLIALGPTGTVLARKLMEAGRRGLDIGHLSDSYRNVFENAARPEAKPVSKA